MWKQIRSTRCVSNQAISTVHQSCAARAMQPTSVRRIVFGQAYPSSNACLFFSCSLLCCFLLRDKCLSGPSRCPILPDFEHCFLAMSNLTSSSVQGTQNTLKAWSLSLIKLSIASRRALIVPRVFDLQAYHHTSHSSLVDFSLIDPGAIPLYPSNRHKRERCGALISLLAFWQPSW